GPEILDRRDCGSEAPRRAEIRRGVEGQRARLPARHVEQPGLEGMKQRLCEIVAHGRLPAKEERARSLRPAPVRSIICRKNQASASSASSFFFSLTISLPVAWSTTFMDRRTLP